MGQNNSKSTESNGAQTNDPYKKVSSGMKGDGIKKGGDMSKMKRTAGAIDEPYGG